MTDTSTVGRFRPYAIYDGGVRSGMDRCDFGGFVRYDDYAALLAERDKLKPGTCRNNGKSVAGPIHALLVERDALQAKVAALVKTVEDAYIEGWCSSAVDHGTREPETIKRLAYESYNEDSRTRAALAKLTKEDEGWPTFQRSHANQHTDPDLIRLMPKETDK